MTRAFAQLVCLFLSAVLATSVLGQTLRKSEGHARHLTASDDVEIEQELATIEGVGDDDLKVDVSPALPDGLVVILKNKSDEGLKAVVIQGAPRSTSERSTYKARVSTSKGDLGEVFFSLEVKKKAVSQPTKPLQLTLDKDQIIVDLGEPFDLRIGSLEFGGDLRNVNVKVIDHQSTLLAGQIEAYPVDSQLYLRGQVHRAGVFDIELSAEVGGTSQRREFVKIFVQEDERIRFVRSHNSEFCHAVYALDAQDPNLFRIVVSDIRGAIELDTDYTEKFGEEPNLNFKQVSEGTCRFLRDILDGAQLHPQVSPTTLGLGATRRARGDQVVFRFDAGPSTPDDRFILVVGSKDQAVSAKREPRDGQIEYFEATLPQQDEYVILVGRAHTMQVLSGTGSDLDRNYAVDMLRAARRDGAELDIFAYVEVGG